ncbi:MAG: hypothetical protein R3272_14620 [Candidatus Promineifilaceae bacterium]|nr:hypothetical protein [Candidatus Promineifilaceae bacterium]
MERWKTIVVLGVLIIALGIFVGMVAGAPAFAQAFAEPDNPDSAENLPANAIPVRCHEPVAPNTKDDIGCVRADTGASFLAVPANHYLLVTDVLINRNALEESGNYFATLGANSAGILPGQPSMEFSGTPLQTDFYSFQAPYIILEGGENLQGRNDSNSDFGIEFYVSGFLVDDVTYQVLMQNYLPAIMRE